MSTQYCVSRELCAEVILGGGTVKTAGTLFIPRVDAPHVHMHALTLGCFHSLTNTQTFKRALTSSVDSCAETKSAPSVA